MPQEATDKNTQCKVAVDKLHCILFGGDQLTRKRAETAIELRQNSTTPITRLKGVQPVCEDWHAKKCFLEVFNVHTYVCMCMYMYVCMYVCMHACMYVCMCMYMYV